MFGQLLIAFASRLVPSARRTEWRAHWDATLTDLSILDDRGELPAGAASLRFRHCSEAFLDAFWLRFHRDELRRFVRGPAFVFVFAIAVALVLAAATGGFGRTRAIAHLSSYYNAHPLRRGDPFGTFLSYAVPIVFALIVGVVLAAMRAPSLQRFGWRYWSFFIAKTVLIIAIVPVLWIEINPLIQSLRPRGESAMIISALLSRLAFIVSFGWALGWSFADQRRRCPVCLKLLALPVSLGALGSVYEPLTTEFLCEDGHGSLSLPGSELNRATDRWIKLDESWNDLFEVKSR